MRLSNPVKRLAVLALHEIAIHYPDQVSPLVGLQPRSEYIQVLGAGADTIVYKVSDQIVNKVHKSSIGATEGRMEQIAARKLKLHGLLRCALPEFCPEQTTYVGEHPVYPKLPVVVTEQSFKSKITAAKLFVGGTNKASLPALRLLTEQGSMLDQLATFVTRGQELALQEGYVPDVMGPRNLIVDSSTDSLILLDGQPLPAHLKGGMNSFSRLQSLAVALNKVA
jgi:hypothetical protein